MPLLTHLPPPLGLVPIALKRFSPYFDQPAEHGLSLVRPAAAYFHVFPLPPEALGELAFYFDFASDDQRNPLV